MRRRTSATTIQKVFRRHQQRRQAITPATLVRPREVPEEVASAVKMQSFIRGNLVRKKIRKALLSPRGPNIVCLRVASSSTAIVSNQSSHEGPRSIKLRSQTCVYAMPERPGKSPPTPWRTSTSSQNQEEFLDEYRSLNKTRGVAKPPARRSKPRWGGCTVGCLGDVPHSTHEPAPPGVEFVKHAKRPEVQPDKVNSPRTTSIVSASKVHHGGEKETKPSVRLPAIGSQLEQRKSSLLCSCYLLKD
ncbi:IQ motif, EF-hand binding site [Phytophthora cactorum]|nr:IQ motif, EF-hand binding site [Phytophthora cactorum]